MEVVAARLLASRILQEYDAFTVDKRTWIAARYNLVEIAEASRSDAKLFKLDGRNPASVQTVEVVAAGCPANQFGNHTDSKSGNM